MLFSLLIIFLITFSGMILTYLYEKEESLLVRVCAGNVIGSAFFGLVAFVFASIAGLSVVTVLFSLIVTLLPLLLLLKKEYQQPFIGNLRQARGKFEGTNFRKFTSFLYYTIIFLIICVFFERAMLETKDGIFTGASNNLGDLPFHLGAIFSFIEGNNFPPENPSFAGAKFTYPFMADLIVACLAKVGATVRDAMFFQNITLGFSLFVLLEKFTLVVTKSRLAGKIAPWLLLFSGGLGFVIFFRDYMQDERALSEFLFNLQKDYTINPESLRWGNPMIVLFITQRSILFGMPIVLIALTYLWQIFTSDSEAKEDTDFKAFIYNSLPLLFLGIVVGTLPLIHVHSLFALFIVTLFLILLDFKKLRTYLIFGMGVSLLAMPQLFWALTGSASDLTKFFDFNFGWDKGEANFVWFWLINLGLFIPLTAAALFLIQNQKEKKQIESEESNFKLNSHLKFYIPFLFIFALTNLMKLAPWQWDNIKVLIYWFVGSIPFVAWLLAWLWEKNFLLKMASIMFLIMLTLSGAIDVWRVMSKQINYEVFNNESLQLAEELKQKTDPQAMFLNAPTYNSTIVMTGRRSVMRYIGHLSSYGIDYEAREREVMKIYEGSPMTESLLEKYQIEYVVISPEERNYMATLKLNFNEAYFQKYPKIAEFGQYTVYKVK